MFPNAVPGIMEPSAGPKVEFGERLLAHISERRPRASPCKPASARDAALWALLGAETDHDGIIF
jgi:hypothetical protein